MNEGRRSQRMQILIDPGDTVGQARNTRYSPDSKISSNFRTSVAVRSSALRSRRLEGHVVPRRKGENSISSSVDTFCETSPDPAPSTMFTRTTLPEKYQCSRPLRLHLRGGDIYRRNQRIRPPSSSQHCDPTRA